MRLALQEARSFIRMETNECTYVGQRFKDGVSYYLWLAYITRLAHTYPTNLRELSRPFHIWGNSGLPNINDGSVF